MDAVIERLEAVATRLEAAEGKVLGQAASTPKSSNFTPPKFSVALPGLATPGKEIPISHVNSKGSTSIPESSILADWDVSVVPVLEEFVKTAESIGGDVLKASQIVQRAFKAERTVVDTIQQCQKPDQAGLSSLVTPVGVELQAADTFAGDRHNTAIKHSKVVTEALQALVWVVYTGPSSGMSPPAQHIEEAWQTAEFWANKVLMEFRSSEPTHVTWVKGLNSLLQKMKGHVQKFHPTGPAWNPKGKPVSAFAPGGDAVLQGVQGQPNAQGTQGVPKPTGRAPPPPPPPPAGSLHNKKDANGASKSNPAAGLSAVFTEINQQGDGVTSGLRKVTDDMKTKNRADRSGVVTSTSVASGYTRPNAQSKAAGPARVECEQGRKWIVENQVGNHSIVIDDTTPKQTVYIYRCRNSTIQIKGKVNAITIDESTKTGVVFEDLVASCELVNSSSLQVQVTGLVPTIAVDKCDGIQLYLSEASMTASITTAKSSAVNVLVPGRNGEDMQELYVPEQFVSSFENGKLVTAPVTHSGG